VVLLGKVGREYLRATRAGAPNHSLKADAPVGPSFFSGGRRSRGASLAQTLAACKEMGMLKKDKEDFLAFVSGDLVLTQKAVDSLNAREKGHFEDHPMSSKFVKQYLNELVNLWRESSVGGAREWTLQFIADAGVSNENTKPLIVAALSDPSCPFLPTVIYLMSTSPNLFADSGKYLLPLASHPDREVRWRVAYFISKVKSPDQDMKRCIELLKQDRDDTTQVYVRACAGR
jgi:hypothetical protein